MEQQRTVVFAMCGSFCTFDKVIVQVRRLVEQGFRVLPLMSFAAAGMDTRFGTARGWKDQLRLITGYAPIETLQEAEPLGPKNMADAMIVAPCTGATLGRLANGISDTPVTLGVKSRLRGGKPIVLAVSTNDGLGASLVNLGTLLNRKHYYLVPVSQDAPLKKPASLQSDFALLPDVLECALRGRQFQPVLLS